MTRSPSPEMLRAMPKHPRLYWILDATGKPLDHCHSRMEAQILRAKHTALHPGRYISIELEQPSDETPLDNTRFSKPYSPPRG